MWWYAPIKRIQNITHNAASLNAKQLTESAGKSLGETLKEIPGVKHHSSGPRIFKPVIHGVHTANAFWFWIMASARRLNSGAQSMRLRLTLFITSNMVVIKMHRPLNMVLMRWRCDCSKSNLSYQKRKVWEEKLPVLVKKWTSRTLGYLKAALKSHWLWLACSGHGQTRGDWLSYAWLFFDEHGFKKN